MITDKVLFFSITKNIREIFPVIWKPRRKELSMSDDARIHDDASSVSAGDPADSQRREAMKLVGTAALMAAPAGSALLASQPAAASPPSLHGSQEAWQEFQAEANRFRDWMLSQPFANSPLIRAQADFLAMQLPSFTFMYYGGSHTGGLSSDQDGQLLCPPALYDRLSQS